MAKFLYSSLYLCLEIRYLKILDAYHCSPAFLKGLLVFQGPLKKKSQGTLNYKFCWIHVCESIKYTNMHVYEGLFNSFTSCWFYFLLHL